ncbi:MAG TPA: LUD domain-containing protein [Candidatus Eremiobacteraceae bacterium]|nr:LUD domain-containing protein [Candidatus Eremiobacteraceae bacterium]
MDARTEIFASIAAALADVRDPDAVRLASAPSIHTAVPSDLKGPTPVGPSVLPDLKGPTSVGPSERSLYDQFAAELAAVGGHAMLIADPAPSALSRAIADLVNASGGNAVVQRSELAVAAASEIPPATKIDADEARADDTERAAVSVIEAEALIAETGSAIVFVSTYASRLLPYLPPSCIIVARASALRAGLDCSALGGVKEDRGERVIITGPSRTADIEKTIVLGAHGPASLTVIVWETEEPSIRV